MTHPRSRTRWRKSAFDLLRLDQRLAQIQLGILITAIIVVPLVVLPESNFLDITSNPKTTILRMLGTFQVGILLSRLLVAVAIPGRNRFIASLQSIKFNRPVLLILGSITAVTFISLVSTVLSILPTQSWWGRVPAGFEAGEYTALMYIALAIGVFVTFRERDYEWFWKTVTITAFLAGFVGFSQYLGLSLLDISTTHTVRLTGTNGNPIFFGAMLVVLGPAALGYLFFAHQSASNTKQRYWLAAIAVLSLILTISLVGTSSRGPWVGALAGGVVAVGTLAIYGRSRLNLNPVLTTAVAIVLGGIIVTFIDATPPDSSSSHSSNLSSAVAGVGGSSTLDLRVRYWELSANVSIDREPVPYTADASRIVRLLFGYGPDMFRFAGTYFADSTTFTRRLTAAHNDPINRLIEQGIFGFSAWISLWISLAYGCLILIRRTGLTFANPTAWIAIGITTALASRFVEQMFGSPTPGGVLIFWTLTTALAAMLMMPREQSAPPPVVTNPSPVKLITVFTGVFVVTIVSIFTAWDRGATYLIANQIASFQQRTTIVSADNAIDRLEQATKFAPDVPRYWNDLAEIEHGRAKASENPQVKAEALSRAYEYDLIGYEANPMEVNSIYKLAFSAWESGNAGRPELRQEAVRLYELLTEIIPSDELAQERLQILSDYLTQE